VDGLRRRFAALTPDFAFVWLDVRNGDYNEATGVIVETAARFSLRRRLD